MTDSVEEAVLARDDARYRAMTAGDSAALASYLDDALTYCHSTGAVENKVQYLDAIASERVRYVAVDREVARFHTWHACSVMQGSVRVHAEVAGKAYRARAAFTATWVHTGGEWRLAAWAATPLS